MKNFPLSWAFAPVRRLAAVIAAGAFFLPAVASANLLTNGDFESGGITSGGFAENNLATYNNWRDVNQWQRICVPGNCFAQHVAPDGDHTNLLMQGFVAPAAGTTLQISFDYIFDTTLPDHRREFVIYGVNAGGTVSQFGPWPVTNGSLLTTISLDSSAVWRSFSTSFTLGADYSAIVVGFLFRSADEANREKMRAVDNVVVMASVPTPAPLALFGLGLILVGLSRKLRVGSRRMI
jgi:hypothetical protein